MYFLLKMVDIPAIAMLVLPEGYLPSNSSTGMPMVLSNWIITPI